MFPRRLRVSRSDFAAGLSEGRRLSSAHFTAILPRFPVGYAVVVSKKVARLSVTRHRMKRQILGILRSLPTLPPALILFPKSSAARLDAHHMAMELAELLRPRSLKRTDAVE